MLLFMLLAMRQDGDIELKQAISDSLVGETKVAVETKHRASDEVGISVCM